MSAIDDLSQLVDLAFQGERQQAATLLEMLWRSGQLQALNAPDGSGTVSSPPDPDESGDLHTARLLFGQILCATCVKRGIPEWPICAPWFQDVVDSPDAHPADAELAAIHLAEMALRDSSRPGPAAFESLRAALRLLMRVLRAMDGPPENLNQAVCRFTLARTAVRFSQLAGATIHPLAPTCATSAARFYLQVGLADRAYDGFSLAGQCFAVMPGSHQAAKLSLAAAKHCLPAGSDWLRLVEIEMLDIRFLGARFYGVQTDDTAAAGASVIRVIFLLRMLECEQLNAGQDGSSITAHGHHMRLAELLLNNQVILALNRFWVLWLLEGILRELEAAPARASSCAGLDAALRILESARGALDKWPDRLALFEAGLTQQALRLQDGEDLPAPARARARRALSKLNAPDWMKRLRRRLSPLVDSLRFAAQLRRVFQVRRQLGPDSLPAHAIAEFAEASLARWLELPNGHLALKQVDFLRQVAWDAIDARLQAPASMSLQEMRGQYWMPNEQYQGVRDMAAQTAAAWARSHERALALLKTGRPFVLVLLNYSVNTAVVQDVRLGGGFETSRFRVGAFPGEKAGLELVQLVERRCPVLQVADPRDDTVAALTADDPPQLQLLDNEWMWVVSALVKRAASILVLVAAPTKGLKFELETVVAHGKTNATRLTLLPDLTETAMEQMRMMGAEKARTLDKDENPSMPVREWLTSMGFPHAPWSLEEARRELQSWPALS